MNTNLVSIIIPTYNNPDELIRALRSVLNQTYKTIEILVVNDGSTVSYETAIEFINSQEKHPIYYFEKSNEGPGIARQYGLERSKGKYIQYLDSDDELLLDKVDFQVDVLKKNPNVIMTYGLSMINNNKNKLHRKKNIRLEIDDIIKSTLEVRKWHTSSSLWNYSCKKYWYHLYNGEDVLHDFNAGLLNEHRKVIFTQRIVTNINFDNSAKHLSNAAIDLDKRKRLVEDGVYLNSFLLKGLIDNELFTKDYKEPLAERFFHTAIKFIIWGYKKEAKDFLYKSQQLTTLNRKKLEIILIRLLMNTPEKHRRKIYQKFYRLHRIINPPETHQFRFV